MTAFEILLVSRESREPLTYVPRFRNPRWLDEVGGDGGGSFEIRLDDPTYVAHRSEFVEGTLVRMTVGGTVGWWEIQAPSTTQVDDQQNLWLTIAGPGLRSWLRGAIVYPAAGTIGDAYTRRFGFMNPQGAWYRPADWAAAPQVIGPVDLTSLYGATPPADWKFPSSQTVSWVWDRTATPMPAGDVYFRREFSTTGAARTFRLTATAAGVARVYLDSVPVLTITEFNAYRHTYNADVKVPAGQHVLAVQVTAPGTRAGLALGLVDMGDPDAAVVDDITVGTPVVWTGQAGWVMNAYPAQAPGWSAGQILGTLLAEARARNVAGLSALGETFTAAVDSYGQPWGDVLDWSVSVGTKYHDVADQFADLGWDLWVDSDWKISMAPVRGVDRASTKQPVAFQPGFNVTKAKAAPAQDEIVNTLLVNSSNGLVEVADTSGSVQRYGRREDYLAASSASMAGSGSLLVEDVFAKRAAPRRHPTLEIIARPRHTPFVDFQTGDLVQAPSDADPGTLVPRRVVSLSVAEDVTAERLVYAVEIDSIAETTEQRLTRWLNRYGPGSVSGSVSGGQGGDGSLVEVPAVPRPPDPTNTGDPTLRQTPATPTTLTYGTAQTVVAGEIRTIITLGWQPVTLDVNGDAIVIDSYEVWAFQDYQSDAEWQWVATVTGTQATFGRYVPQTQWEFKVRAIAQRSAIPSAFSLPAVVIMPTDQIAPPVPSKPILATHLAQVTVTWDGLAVSGTYMPMDFAHVDVKQESNGRIVGRLVGPQDQLIVNDLTIGATESFRLRAVDSSGNASGWSEAQPIKVSALVDPASITSGMLAPSSVTTLALQANAITADKLAAGLVLVTDIIAGNPSGTHASMEPTGFRVYRADPTTGAPREVLRLGTATNDYIGVVRSDGVPIASINEAGIGTFQQVNIPGDLWYKGQELGYVLSKFPKGIASRGYLGATISQIASSRGLFEVPFRCEPQRGYAFNLSLLYYPQGYENESYVTLRYTTDGSVPTVNSPVLASFPTGTIHAGLYTLKTLVQHFSAVDFGVSDSTGPKTVRVLVLASAGSQGYVQVVGGNANSQLAIADEGVMVPVQNILNDGIGGVSGQAIQTYDLTYDATWAASYRPDGSFSALSPKMYQGWTSTSIPDHSIAGFPDFTALLAGANVTGIWVYFNFLSWYWNTGGTALIGVHGYVSQPTTLAPNTGQSTVVGSTGWPKPGARWIDITGTAYGWKSGQFRGVGLDHAGSQDPIYQGYADPPKIRLQFQK